MKSRTPRRPAADLQRAEAARGGGVIKHKLSRDGEEAICDVLENHDLAPEMVDDFLVQCAKIVRDFRPRHRTNINRRREALPVWCEQSAKAIRRLRKLLVRTPSTVRVALRRDLKPISARLPHVERQLRQFAKAARDQMPSNRPRIRPGMIWQNRSAAGCFVSGYRWFRLRPEHSPPSRRSCGRKSQGLTTATSTSTRNARLPD